MYSWLCYNCVTNVECQLCTKVQFICSDCDSVYFSCCLMDAVNIEIELLLKWFESFSCIFAFIHVKDFLVLFCFFVNQIFDWSIMFICMFLHIWCTHIYMICSVDSRIFEWMGEGLSSLLSQLWCLICGLFVFSHSTMSLLNSWCYESHMQAVRVRAR